jgi:flagellar assembly factor FliW
MSERIIQSSRFGEISIENEALLTFSQPILGFETLKEYALVEHAPDSPFQWLQSTENPELAFVVTNPTSFGLDYEFEIPDDLVDLLEISTIEEVLVLTIVNVPNDAPAEMTANLMGPIIINTTTKNAVQFALSDNSYGTKVRLIPDTSVQKMKMSSSRLDQMHLISTPKSSEPAAGSMMGDES